MLNVVTHITQILELLAIVRCIHWGYGQKMKFNRRILFLIAGGFAVLVVMKYLQLSTLVSFFNLVLFYVYSKIEFRRTWIVTIINLILHITIITMVEFVCALIVSMFNWNRGQIQDLISVILVLIISYWGLSRINSKGIYVKAFKNERKVYFALFIILLIILFILLQGKLGNRINIVMFIFSIPALILGGWVFIKWNTSQDVVEEIKNEYASRVSGEEKYEELLQDIRMRQHEYKNHLAAILATHHTHDSYEQLVQAQKEYTDALQKENKYNELIGIGDKVLVGFLFTKFQELEKGGISIWYSGRLQAEDCEVPMYHLIEMLGILLDNAKEAVEKQERKSVRFEITNREEEVVITVSNQSPYLSYEEITDLFQLGNSSKGNGRGIGLYHLKCLCEEWNCDLQCRCREMEHDNWIEFSIGMKKADGQ